MWNVSFVSVIPNVATVVIWWQERYFSSFDELHSSLVAFCLTFRSSWLFPIVFAPMNGLENVFLQSAITEIVLYTSPTDADLGSSIFSICYMIRNINF